jgi:hypothetical protein
MRKEEAMSPYETPCFVEIKMDAEIGSYQEDTDPLREGPAFVEERAEAAE